ncbi:hypothetical protein G6F40_017091 [Rhizopus arrhizus]|nr:hypothetical protein G6F40_017091 [Rhizopus arrhizus]
MAAEEPQVRADIQFGAYHAFAMRSAVLADFGDAVEHQHRIVGQTAGGGAEQFTACAGQQLVAVERVETSHGKRNPGSENEATIRRGCTTVEAGIKPPHSTRA